MEAAPLNTVSSDTALVGSLLSLFAQDTIRIKQVLSSCLGPDIKKIPNADSRIGLYDQLSIVSKTNEILEKDWAYKTPQFWQSALDNIFCSAVRTAPTLSDGLDLVVKYGFLWSSAIYFEGFISDDNFYLMVGSIPLEGPDIHFQTGLDDLCELSLTSIYLLLDETLRGRWPKAEVFFRQKAQQSGAAQAFYACPVKYKQARYGLKIPLKLCLRKSVKADDAKFRKASYMVKNLVHSPSKDRTVESLVTDFINTSQFHRPTLSEAAKSLGMSSRTLNRRLEKLGLSFRALLEKSLKARAETLIAQGILSRGDIADRLGYKDQASFSRAIKRWKSD